MKKIYAAAFLALLLLFPAAVRAEDPGPAEEIPPLASEEEAKEALDAFKEAWKARGLRGDERTAVREVAMRRLAQVQHPLVSDRLAKLTRDRNEDIKTLAVMYLGDQRALPGYAGPLVVKALEANSKDPVFVMFAIESIETLDYRGAKDALKALLAHKDQGVQKVALLTIGDTEDVRLIEDLLNLMQELKIDAGVKWEGGEVRYDTGTAGTHDQEMAEKIYKEKYGNKAKAGRKAGRAMRDMRPILLEAMKRLTGQEFITTKQAREWYVENLPAIEIQQKVLDDIAREQARAAKDM